MMKLHNKYLISIIMLLFSINSQADDKNITAYGVVNIKGGVHDISANLNGVIKQIYVSPGDYVTKGQKLAIQHSKYEELAIARSQSAINIDKSKIELIKYRIKRYSKEIELMRPLVSKGTVSRLNFEAVEDKLFQSNLELKMAESSLMQQKTALEEALIKKEQRVIISPINGTISEIHSSAGFATSIQNTTKVFSIIPDAPLIIEAYIELNQVQNLVIGQKAKVTAVVGAKNKIYDAHIERISKYIDKDLSTKEVIEQTSYEQKLPITLKIDGKSDLIIGQKVLVFIDFGDNP